MYSTITCDYWIAATLRTLRTLFQVYNCKHPAQRALIIIIIIIIITALPKWLKPVVPANALKAMWWSGRTTTIIVNLGTLLERSVSPRENSPWYLSGQEARSAPPSRADHPFLLLGMEQLHGCPITTLTELPHLQYIFWGHDNCKTRRVKEYAVSCGNATLRLALPNLYKHDQWFHLQDQECAHRSLWLHKLSN